MRGTWQTTDSGPGPAVLAVVVIVLAIGAAAWAAARIWWILAGAAMAVAVTAAAVLWLIRWSDRRAARVFAHRDCPQCEDKGWIIRAGKDAPYMEPCPGCGAGIAAG